MNSSFNFISYTKITKISCCVCLNNEFFGIFNSKTLSQLKIKNNSNLDNKQIFELTQNLTKSCNAKAFQILSRRDHSKFELIKKLKKFANEKVANEVAEKMQRLGFVHDLKYAKNLAEKLITQKFYSKNRAIFELKLKGINNSTAIDAIDSLKINTEIIIKKLIKKKYANKLNCDTESKNKVIRAIMQKGHSLGETLHAIESFQKNDY